MSLGKRIRVVRKELNLTQEQLASLIGCNRVSVTNWESDRNSPDRDSFLALSEALHVNSKWLMSGEGPKRHSDAALEQPPAKESPTTELLAAEMLERIAKEEHVKLNKHQRKYLLHKLESAIKEGMSKGEMEVASEIDGLGIRSSKGSANG